MEILDGIHRIDAEVAGRPLHLFLVLGERKLLLDAGCATTVADTLLPYLGALGLGPRDLDLLVITHSDFDHQGGAHALKSANRELTVACGALDRELVSDPDAIVARRYDAFRVDHGIGYDGNTTAWIREMCGLPQPVDAVFNGGETIDLGAGTELRVFHVPGHSPGHLAVQDNRSGALFSGDCVQGSVYLGLDGTPKLCPTYTDVDPYLQTIALISALAPSELHGCHWPASRGAEVAGDRVQVPFDRVGEKERLPEPDQTLVGVHEDVDEARELVQAERVDAGDFHRSSRGRYTTWPAELRPAWTACRSA